MNVKYVGPAKDYSGYGEAVRHDILALLAAGVTVTGEFPRYTPEIADFGSLGEKLSVVEGINVDYETLILHTTPNVYQKYIEPGKYHIARVFWETDKLPPAFAENIELCDEIWTGSAYNAAAIKNSGVTKPIKIVPQAIDTSLDIGKVKPYILPIADDTLKFYSIFEWTERKNPLALLEAYWRAFPEEKWKVSLSIKTYVDSFDKGKHDEILQAIKRLKNHLGLSYYAPVQLYRNLMDRPQIYRFHKSFDVFVSAHRGEGWGIPQMEAMYFNNPIISTNCGGIHEYLHDTMNAYLVGSVQVSLTQNSRNQQWYLDDQKWAQIDIEELRETFLSAYNNKFLTETIGLNGGAKVREAFSPDVVGARMLHCLENRGMV